MGKKNNIDIVTYQLSRSENNNGCIVSDWIRRNLSEADCYKWNIADYMRAIEDGTPLLDLEFIKKYFINPSNTGIKDVIFSSNDELANIVILNLGIGSFLDIFMRKGKKSLNSIRNSFERDRSGIVSILEMVQSSNRNDKTKTQIYLCGAPNVSRTFITNLFMNGGIKRVGREFANVTYVPSFKRQTIYKKTDGSHAFDIHYNRAEYLHFLRMIEKKIIENYSLKDAMISIDSELFKMSCENDTNMGKKNMNDALDIIDIYAKSISDSDEYYDYNMFIDYVSNYISVRYPYDFYRINNKQNLGKIISKKLKK